MEEVRVQQKNAGEQIKWIAIAIIVVAGLVVTYFFVTKPKKK